MAAIAKASITLISVSDAYSVSLQPSNITISADYNGLNPRLDNAYTIISLYCGDKQIPISRGDVLNSSIEFSKPKKFYTLSQYGDSLKLQITDINTENINGWLELEIFTQNNQRFTARFTYTIVRETSMLDWVLEWNKQYTEISGDHVATPNAFIGSSSDAKTLSGVYIGADMPGHSIGIYSVKDCPIEAFTTGNISNYEIFHLNETGGMIGGWHIENGGIQTSDGYLKILSEGSIVSAPNGEIAWGIYKDGTATFANGNVCFYPDGEAHFSGSINTVSGKIGEWRIGKYSLYNSAILIDSANRFIGVRNLDRLIVAEPTKADFYKDITCWGGISLGYNHDNDYGLECWQQGMLVGSVGGTSATPRVGQKVFSLGSENMIAGWHFDHTAIYLGAKNNTAKQNTSKDGDITIGTNGLRGANWYIDTDGEISFVDGLLHFDKEGGLISGWKINAHSLMTKHIALTSYDSNAGLFISKVDLTESNVANYTNLISQNGGMYFKTDENISQLAAYADLNGKVERIFMLSTYGVSHIATWRFNQASLYTGNAKDVSGAFTDNKEFITIGATGIRGYKWRLESDGSGAIAGGNIEWDADGVTRLAPNVWLSWDSESGTGTQIGADGVFSGKIKADNITAGTISTATIRCAIEGNIKWVLNNDGSGSLASGNIFWDADGGLTIKGALSNPWEAHMGSHYLNGGDEDAFWRNKFQWVNIMLSPYDLYPNKLLELGGNEFNNGRLIRLINQSTGNIQILTGESLRIWESGRRAQESFWVKAGQIVELIGFWQDNTRDNTFAWLVLNRRDINTSKAYGSPDSVLARGRILVQNNEAKIITYGTFDGSQLDIGDVIKPTQQYYKIIIPASWGLDNSDYNLILQPIGANSESKIMGFEEQCFTFSATNGEYMFELVPMDIYPAPLIKKIYNA